MFDDRAQKQPPRRYWFSAERTQRADIAVIATTEEEGRDKAQAELNENWDDDTDEGEADLSLGMVEDLTDEEIKEYFER